MYLHYNPKGLCLRKHVCAHTRSIHINYFLVPVSNTIVEKKLYNVSLIEFKFTQAKVVIWITYRKISFPSKSFFKFTTVLLNELCSSSADKVMKDTVLVIKSKL